MASPSLRVSTTSSASGSGTPVVALDSSAIKALCLRSLSEASSVISIGSAKLYAFNHLVYNPVEEYAFTHSPSSQLPLKLDGFKIWGYGPLRPPLELIPAHLFYYPHAVDAMETNESLLLSDRLPEKRGALSKEYAYAQNGEWAETLESMESHLSKPFGTLSALEIQVIIENLYKTLCRSKECPYRKHPVIVKSPATKSPCSQLLTEAAAHHHSIGNTDLAKSLERVSELFHTHNEQAYLHFKEEDWKPFCSVFFIPVSYRLIEERMGQFCQQLRMLCQEDRIHPFQIAAFIHFGITTIHPFADKNGRMARLVMNLFLMQKGYLPFIPLNAAEYAKMTVLPAELYEAEFTHYLHRSLTEIEKQIEEKTLPSIRFAKKVCGRIEEGRVRTLSCYPSPKFIKYFVEKELSQKLAAYCPTKTLLSQIAEQFALCFINSSEGVSPLTFVNSLLSRISDAIPDVDQAGKVTGIVLEYFKDFPKIFLH